MKRLLVISDLHCGHFAGICPPSHHEGPKSKRTKIRALQEQTWQWYAATVHDLAPAVVVVNGDAIEGKGDYSGGVECWSTDRTVQEEAACEVIRAARARKVIVIAGTPRHTAHEGGEECEQRIAGELNAVAYSGQEFVQIEGVTFHFRHHIGGSQIAHARHTPVARERVANLLWEDRQPRAQVIVRSHVHYLSYCGGPDWLALTTPALQAAATRFGRRCSGTVDYGVVTFDCERGGYSWQAHLLRAKAEKARLLRV